MKRIALAGSVCICGFDVPFTIKKPKPFQPTIVKVTCPGCFSRYVLSVNKSGIDFRHVELSDFALENFPSWREQL